MRAESNEEFIANNRALSVKLFTIMRPLGKVSDFTIRHFRAPSGRDF